MHRAIGALVAAAFLTTGCNGGSEEPAGVGLDPGFGHDGKVVVALTRGNDLPHDAVLQPDGKVVVGGLVDNEFGLSRFDRNGRLDPTFGTRGRTRQAVGQAPLSPNAIQVVTLQSDGKIVAAGGIESLSLTVVRFTRKGRLDRTFGNGGRVDLPAGQAGGLALDKRGRIVLTGVGVNGAFIARLTSNGRLDDTFGDDGIVRVSRARHLGLTPARPLIERDGSIVVPLSDRDFGLVLRRYRHGTRDNRFGARPTKLLLSGRSIARDSEGGFLVAGYLEGDQAKCKGPCAVPAVVRLSPHGTVDHDFADNGRAVLAPEAEDFDSVAVGARGGAMFAATGALLDVNESAFLVRPLTHAGAGGATRTDMGSWRRHDIETVATVLVRPNGRVVVVGGVAKAADKHRAILFSVALAQYRS